MCVADSLGCTPKANTVNQLYTNKVFLKSNKNKNIVDCENHNWLPFQAHQNG